MNNQNPKPDNSEDHGTFEHQDMTAGSVLYFLLTLAVVTVICMFGLRGLYAFLDHRVRATQSEVNPLVTNAPEDTRHVAPAYPQTAFPSPRLEEDERGQLNGIRLTARQHTLQLWMGGRKKRNSPHSHRTRDGLVGAAWTASALTGLDRGCGHSSDYDEREDKCESSGNHEGWQEVSRKKFNSIYAVSLLLALLTASAWSQMNNGVMSPPANTRPPRLENVGIEQHLDAQVPPDLDLPRRNWQDRETWRLLWAKAARS